MRDCLIAAVSPGSKAESVAAAQAELEAKAQADKSKHKLEAKAKKQTPPVAADKIKDAAVRAKAVAEEKGR